jgi:predicted DNA-binding transcriptional regulator YafY
VVSFQGHEGGFCIMDNYRISRQFLTFEDICSIVNTLKGINRTLADRDLDEVIEKIECLVPQDRETEFRNRSEQIVFDIEPWAADDRFGHLLRTLHQAIHEQRLVSFTYTNVKLHEMQRSVEPMTLVFKAYSWYLFGYCRKRGDYRIFKLSRIRSLLLTGDRFVRREKSYREVMSMQGQAPAPVTYQLLFSPNARVMVEDSFPSEQVRIREDGRVEVNAVFPEDEWVYSWLLSFGSQVEVVGPEFMRKELIKRIEAIQSVYMEE